MHLILICCITLLLFSCVDKDKKSSSAQQTNAPDGMVWIPGGEFTMGTDEMQSYEYERPSHRVKVDGFWMDETEVTNKQFREFVDDTDYITTAERTPDWNELRKQLPPDAPMPDKESLVAGSLVFTPPDHAVSLDDYSQWWKWTPGANWKHPEGPDSDLKDRWNHPVVHVSYEDAIAYCKWADKRLPTEAEWEFASRGGKESQRYSWGEELNPQGKMMANIFQGAFPINNTGDDGFKETSPVKSFPPNTYGLYDIIGNCWEWTNDLYNVKYYSELAAKGIANNPRGASVSFDPMEPMIKKRVTRGGSFLCADDYCINYRPSARQGSAEDTGMSHIGFRCVKN